MPALSFKREWLDALLRGDKQQTTRAPPPYGKPPRIKVGDVAHVYLEQRRRITDKPLRQMTELGIERVRGRYPIIPEFFLSEYHAHFLGKVLIEEVAVLHPAEMTEDALEGWAKLDGFESFDLGDMWFVRHYGGTWDSRAWLVIRWSGWVERYFNATPDSSSAAHTGD